MINLELRDAYNFLQPCAKFLKKENNFIGYNIKSSLLNNNTKPHTPKIGTTFNNFIDILLKP